MLKIPYKTFREVGISIVNHKRCADPFNSIICPPIEALIKNPYYIDNFQIYVENHYITVKVRELNLDDLTSYLISYWIYNTISWSVAYPTFHRRIQFDPYKKRTTYDGKVLTYRGSKLFFNLRPIVKAVMIKRGYTKYA